MHLDAFEALHTPAPASVQIGGQEIVPGSRVRLRPGNGGDIADFALRGRCATVAAIEMTLDGDVHVAVTIDDDPGRDLGHVRLPSHRFFFAPHELEPIAGTAQAPRVLIAGIGNIFHGDDGFGVAVAQRLAGMALPAGVTVTDFGIRSLDLAFTLQHDYELVVLVDAMARGQVPGTLYTIEPDIDEIVPAPNAHELNPVAVLQLARGLGHLPHRIVMLGCEPEDTKPRTFGDTMVELTPAVQLAVDRAVDLLAQLVSTLKPHSNERDLP